MAHAARPDSDYPAVRFEMHPDRYVHWKLSFAGPIATLTMDVQEDRPFRPGYVLKLNSYDLGVDIELADAVQRLRFEHPEVKVVRIASAIPKIFCSGANIYMLGSSTHAFKVNFCKYTNETRLGLEQACAESGQHYVAALNGTASGGGYELALACEEILLADDGSSAVSFPETPLLGVLPGTGGLTRVVDKRKVRRDLADVFSSLTEGVRGKRAESWRLVDKSIAKSHFEKEVQSRLDAIAAATPDRVGAGLALGPLQPAREETAAKYAVQYSSVSLLVDKATRQAELRISGPAASDAVPADAASMRSLGDKWWMLRVFRELDDALLDMRFNHPLVAVVAVHTRGDAARVLAHDEALQRLEGDWLGKEIRLFIARTLKRMDLTARSFFALIEPGSCFAGSLLELALAADRSYLLDDQDAEVGASLCLGAQNFGAYTMSNGLTRLETRFLGEPGQVGRLRELVSTSAKLSPLDAQAAQKQGLVTYAPDALDWEDEVRLALEERASLSPDALTGMEANLRFAGPETMETKIFARLSAWQNWIFQRPNAVGDHGALSLYGQPERAVFDWHRT